MSRTFHYSVTTGNKPNPDKSVDNFCLVIIHKVKDEADAIEQAKQKIKRDYYQVTQIYECHDCARRELDLEYKSTQLKILNNLSKKV